MKLKKKALKKLSSEIKQKEVLKAVVAGNLEAHSITIITEFNGSCVW
ncbi:hypothetical protein L1077_21195 [Pseudoalteromonas luteoviolacea]|nr:hypothetical protein [Pseudoalteromonas luteoviolacea]MCF6441948.1 hypothetical protein [Pseudoalteromonas luteoviolacea]